MTKANERTFQNDMIAHLLDYACLRGHAEHYKCELALYPVQPYQNSTKVFML